LSFEIKEFKNLSDLEKLSLVDFSYSRIDTYEMCPSKYFYSYITKEPRQFAPAATLGNIVHDVFENVLDNEKELILEELHSEYQRVIPIWDPDSLIPADLIQAGRDILDTFYDDNHGLPMSIYDKELSFDIVLGSYRIRGFIDRVDISGRHLTIIDYKTGKWEVAQKNIHDNLQLGIYAMVMDHFFPDKEIYAELYYLRSGKRKGHTYSKNDIDFIKKKLIRSMNHIINDFNYMPTKNTRVCSFCDHAASGVCGTGAYRNRNK
jgi:RecB family exonuclease